MLNPNLSAFLTRKQNAHKGRSKRRGCPVGSSLPGHGTRVWTKTQEKEQQQPKKIKTPRADCKLAQKNRNNNLYDA